MIVTSMNRMARGMDYPKLVDPSAILNTVGIVEAPGTDYSNQFNDGAGLGDFSVIGDYFTSTNYYIGFIAIGLIAFSLFKGGKSNKRQSQRKANLKGYIAREQELLKSA